MSSGDGNVMKDIQQQQTSAHAKAYSATWYTCNSYTLHCVVVNYVALCTAVDQRYGMTICMNVSDICHYYAR